MVDELINESKEVAVFNPSDITIMEESVKPQELPKYWDRDYINEHIVKVSNQRHQTLIRFMWMTGVRVTEAINVRKKDIDFKSFVVNIRWQKSRKYYYRNIPVHPHLRDMLMIYTAPMKAEDLLFPISRQRAWQVVRKAFNGHPHQFRHSFAVNWLKHDGDIVLLSKMLGHARVQNTMIYLNIVPVDIGKELLKIQF
jgi:integrase/recombinase XerD